MDEAGKAAGRGAYVCRNMQCARHAVTQQKLSRALGVTLGEETRKRLEGLISSDLEVPDAKEGGAKN